MSSGANNRPGGPGWAAERPSQAPSVKSGLKAYLVLTFFFSVGVNLLLLVSPFYMIQVYDRVLTSGSSSTLLSLSIIAVFLLGIYAFAEAGRRRTLAVFGRNRLDQEFVKIAKRLLSRQKTNAVSAQANDPSLQDITRVQGALNAGTILPLFDLPFTPAFLAMMFLLHPWIGMVGIGGAIALVSIAVLSERMTSKRYQNDQMAETQSQSFLQEVGAAKNAVISMGMREAILSQWNTLKSGSQDSSLSTSALAGLLSGLSKSFRQILQTLVLGLGAYLALNQEMSPGAIVAGSIIMGRALAPVDQIVGGWKQITMCLQSWKRLRNFKPDEQVESEAIAVSSLGRGLTCQKLEIAPPGLTQPLLEPFDLEVQFGEVVVIVGPSGSGKTCLLQCMSAAWPTMGGGLSLGNRPMADWSDEDRGRFVGYLPQNTELLPGSVADNIRRFTDADDAEVEEAAKKLGFHELFMSFPQGYSTMAGLTGHQFSAGQKQAIGLVRAAFGSSRLLLLDEPTANLDGGLASRFLAALDVLRKSGVAVVITTHDPRLLPHANRLFSTQERQLRQIENPTRGKNIANRPNAQEQKK